MVWETRAGRGGCTAVGFVPAVRIAPPCLPSRPQLLPFHTGRRALTPTTQLARLPPRFRCSSDSDVRPRALRRLVSAPTRTSGPLEELWSSSLFTQASDDLRSVRALQFCFCTSYACPAREHRCVQAQQYPTSYDPVAWYRSSALSPFVVRCLGGLHRDLRLGPPFSKVAAPAGCPNRDSFSMSLGERVSRLCGGARGGTVVGRCVLASRQRSSARGASVQLGVTRRAADEEAR